MNYPPPVVIIRKNETLNITNVVQPQEAINTLKNKTATLCDAVENIMGSNMLNCTICIDTS